MFSLTLKVIPWKATAPEVSETGGTFKIFAGSQKPDVTNLLPVGSQFYFVPASDPPGTSEDPTITRTCTSNFFDRDSIGENTFAFTPQPLNLPWSGQYWIVILYSVIPANCVTVKSATATRRPVTYVTVPSSTGTPNLADLLQAVSTLTPS